MRMTIGAAALLGGMLTTVFAQDTTRQYTRPEMPGRETLERLNLKMAWRAYIPTEGRKDGIATVQMLADLVLVQTRSGLVVALSATDGSTRWRSRFGLAYRVDHPVGSNKDALFAVRGTKLYALDRKNGSVMWQFDMPGGAAAAPAADEERVYLSLGVGRLYVYELPGVFHPLFPGQKRAEPAAAAREASAYGGGPKLTAIGPYSSASSSGQEGARGPQPQFLWDYVTEARLEQAPIVTNDLIVLAGSNGTFVVASKVQQQVPYRFQTGAAIAAPVGFHRALLDNGQETDMAYVASQDFNVYALDVTRGRINWRVTGGAPIMKKPEVTDEDVYIAPERAGLFRINRVNGDTLWKNRTAERYLSSNKKFVYAADRSGRLLILDRALGSQRGVLDTRDFVVPVSNEWTDRFFLASNDGMLLCLHDREYVAPLWTKTNPPPKNVEEAKKVEEAKPDEKKGDDAAAPKEKDMPKEKEKE